jgi:hypothetical protein
MNTDERGYFDAVTERVLGAVFEAPSIVGWFLLYVIDHQDGDRPLLQFQLKPELFFSRFKQCQAAARV